MVKAKRLFYAITYDIACTKKRNKLAKKLEFYGTRVNFSVFECMFTPSQLQKLQEYVQNTIDHKTDSVIFYRICVECFSKTNYFPPTHKSPKATVQIV